MLERPLDTTVEVVTPENVAFEYQLAGVARRASAFLLDFFIRLAFLVVLLIVFLTTGLAELAGGQLFVAVMLLALFASEWFYGGVLESYWNGQTIGKWMQGIRVIRTNGQPLRFPDALVRALSSLFSFFALGLGVLWILKDEERQAWHDKIAGTFVVRVPKAWALL